MTVRIFKVQKMASFSIQKRTLASGETRFTADVVLKQNTKIIQRKSKTFRKKEQAKAWAIKRVYEFEHGNTINKTVTIGDALNNFINEPDLWNNCGRTKKYVIEMLIDCDIAKINTHELKVSDLVNHCKNRRGTGTKPVTIYHDISYLRTALNRCRYIFDINFNARVFDDAIPVLIDMNLIGKSERRTRRPTSNELARLKDGLKQRENFRANGKIRIPFCDILEFSILSCMRIGEVCALRWDDLNIENKTILIRDRKDPRKKQGNHMISPLLGGSFDIVMKQPKINDLIFPYNSRSVTAGFQRVRNALGIKDLRYHDLRREGASRLFEKGYSIEEVAQVTGHRNLNVLWQVYTQLYPHKLHEK